MRKQKAKIKAIVGRVQAPLHDACPNCGMREPHYVSYPASMATPGREGFWTCPKLYGPDGRRIDTSDAPSESQMMQKPGLFAAMLANLLKVG